jgi:hypothetical protein
MIEMVGATKRTKASVGTGFSSGVRAAKEQNEMAGAIE